MLSLTYLYSINDMNTITKPSIQAYVITNRNINNIYIYEDESASPSRLLNGA